MDCKNNVKTHTHFPQLSNRLGSARCGADLILPSAVASAGEQAITIEGRNTASVQIVVKLHTLFYVLQNTFFISIFM